MPQTFPTVRRAALLLTALAGVASFTTSCKGKGQVVYPRKVAAGRPPGCPETNAVPLGADSDSMISADAARCTYADALGGSVTRVSGKVLAESGQAGVPDAGMAEIEVTLHKLKGIINPENPGEQVGRSRTTTQGNYSVSSALRPGRYLLIARDPSSGQVLTHRAFDVSEQHEGPLTDIHIVVPLDPRLRNAPELKLDAGQLAPKNEPKPAEPAEPAPENESQ